MPLNKALIGKEYPASAPYEVGREKIRDFATAIGDFNPIYHDEAAAKAAGYDDIIAPPTFLTTLGFKFGPQVVGDPELGLNYAMVVHGEQEFELVRPVKPGDVLIGKPRISGITARGKNEFMTYEASIETADGEKVAIARSVIVSRGTATQEGSAMTAKVRYADVSEGEELKPWTYDVQRLNLVMYAGASGDFNPIHWNEPFAKAVGLPDVISHGMFTMARIGQFVTDWIGDPGAVKRFKTRFTLPVVVPNEGGNKVTVSGKVSRKLDSNRVVLEVSAAVGDANVGAAEAEVELA